MKEENQPEKPAPQENLSPKQRLVKQVENEKEQLKQNDTSKVLVIPRKALPVLRQFFKQNTSLMFRFIMKKIAEALKNNDRADIKLYQLGDNKTLAVIRYKDVGLVLNDAMAYFSRSEEYELAGKCQSLITRYYVEQVIDDSK